MIEEVLQEKEISNLRQSLSNASKLTFEHFTTLKKLYHKLELNEVQRNEWQYKNQLEILQKNYLASKQSNEEKTDFLKIQYKQIDNRIISAEQKLTHGIPEDLELMEKLIAEQESIVADQEKLNAAEKELSESIRENDIEYGREIQKLEQLRNNRLPKADGFIAYQQEIEIKEKAIEMQSKIISIVAVLLLPLLIDITMSGFIKTATRSNHSIFGHYIFLIALLLSLFFLAEPIRNRIAAYLSKPYILGSLGRLSTLLAEINRR